MHLHLLWAVKVVEAARREAEQPPSSNPMQTKAKGGQPALQSTVPKGQGQLALQTGAVPKGQAGAMPKAAKSSWDAQPTGNAGIDWYLASLLKRWLFEQPDSWRS